LGDAGGSFALPNITNIGIPGVDQLGQIIGAMKSWVKIALWMQNPVNWLRMFTIVAGAVLLLIGIIMLSNQTDNTSAAIKTVKKVVTV
jgi:uncharacterized membrane protein